MRKMEEKHFSEHNDEHVEFLPVEWRSKLTLDGGLCVFLSVCMSEYMFTALCLVCAFVSSVRHVVLVCQLCPNGKR